MKARNAATNPPPDAATLHEAALSYLARFSATEAGLRRVLERRVDRWARAAEASLGAEEATARARAARGAIDPIVARLAGAGVVDDASFAQARARRLAREGKSRRAIAAHLAARGVEAELASQVLPAGDASELASALLLARKRRIGPFRPAQACDPQIRRRELGVLARAGFPAEIAIAALDAKREEAEELLHLWQRETG
jgi:regulatory protein